MDTKLRCILLDDEMPGLAYLKMLCEQLPELEVVKAFNDPEKLLDALPTIEFDLLISDIEMPGIDGLTLATSLQNKLVIFITAYKEYAVDAFEIDAVDYLTKPVKLERLHKAIDKAVERLSKIPTGKRFLQVNSDKGKTLLYFDVIALIRTASTDSRDKEVVCNDGERLLLKNISFAQLLSELPEAHFSQVSKKEVVAVAAVKFFSHEEITLNLNDKSGKPISVNLKEKYRSDFLQKIGR